nr:hypothetical protein [Commensalibacter intestini]
MATSSGLPRRPIGCNLTSDFLKSGGKASSKGVSIYAGQTALTRTFLAA